MTDLDDLRIKRHVSRFFSTQFKKSFEENSVLVLQNDTKKDLSEFLEDYAELLSEKIDREVKKLKMIVYFVLGGFLFGWFVWCLCKANKWGD